MSNCFLGQISMFGGNFAPRNWALCNGQLMSIAQNSALFSLLGTTYGGDGITTFALPNLQSRLPADWGQGPGLSNYQLGQTGGAQSVTLTVQTMPAHIHMLGATTAAGTAMAIGNTVVPAAASGNDNPLFYVANVEGKPNVIPVPLDPGACGPAGGSQPHSNLMPSLCITFMIALSGIFPSRN